MCTNDPKRNEVEVGQEACFKDRRSHCSVCAERKRKEIEKREIKYALSWLEPIKVLRKFEKLQKEKGNPEPTRKNQLRRAHTKQRSELISDHKGKIKMDSLRFAKTAMLSTAAQIEIQSDCLNTLKRCVSSALH